MSFFADTSILCALYREQENSPEADLLVTAAKEVIQISALVVFEFRQSVRLQAFRFSKDRSQGFSKVAADSMLRQLDENIMAGILTVSSVDWLDVYSRAEHLSLKHAFAHGHRSMDILHIATALHLHTQTFFSFDNNQLLLAKAVGLKIS